MSPPYPGVGRIVVCGEHPTIYPPGTRFYEGVPYFRHVVTFRLSDGRRRRWVRYSPGEPWVRSEVARELVERFGLDGIKPRSVTVRPW